LIELVDSIRETITQDILQVAPISGQAGETRLTLPTTANLIVGQSVAIYGGSENCPSSEIHTVCSIIDGQTFSIDSPLLNSYENGNLQPVFENQFVQYVLNGNPPSIPRYPAITIEETSTDNSPLTLGLIEQQVNLRISVWTDKQSYDQSYRLRDTLANRIMSRLFRTAFPVVRPWKTTTLAEDFTAYTDILKVTDNILCDRLLFYLVKDGLRYPCAVVESLNNNVFRISQLFSITFPKGTTVLRSDLHIYKQFGHGIDYINGTDNGTLLMGAILSYSASIARNRYFVPLVG
jgi:hypothetical protein